MVRIVTIYIFLVKQIPKLICGGFAEWSQWFALSSYPEFSSNWENEQEWVLRILRKSWTEPWEQEIGLVKKWRVWGHSVFSGTVGKSTFLDETKIYCLLGSQFRDKSVGFAFIFFPTEWSSFYFLSTPFISLQQKEIRGSQSQLRQV